MALASVQCFRGVTGAQLGWRGDWPPPSTGGGAPDHAGTPDPMPPKRGTGLARGRPEPGGPCGSIAQPQQGGEPPGTPPAAVSRARLQSCFRSARTFRMRSRALRWEVWTRSSAASRAAALRGSAHPGGSGVRDSTHAETCPCAASIPLSSSLAASLARRRSRAARSRHSISPKPSSSSEGSPREGGGTGAEEAPAQGFPPEPAGLQADGWSSPFAPAGGAGRKKGGRQAGHRGRRGSPRPAGQRLRRRPLQRV